MTLHKLPLEFYQRETLEVAEDLMNCYVVRETEEGRIIGRITESEAYLGINDKASHAYGERRTKRTAPLYEAGGIAYIHLIYGIYHCFNVVTEQAGIPQSVLLRGIKVLEGFDLASTNRYGVPYGELSKAQLKSFTNGPGKLCRALSIDTSLNEANMLGGELYLCDEIGSYHKSSSKIVRSKRIGVDYAEEARDFLYRFNI